MFESNNQFAQRCTIKSIGIGGFGAAIIKHLARNLETSIEYLCIDTDKTALPSNELIKTISIAPKDKPWTGVGGSYFAAMHATKEKHTEIIEYLAGTDLLFLFAGLGGVTGSGGIQTLIEFAKHQKIRTIVFFTTPSSLESHTRIKNSREARNAITNSELPFIEFKNNRIYKSPNTKKFEPKNLQQTNNIIFTQIKTCIESISGAINFDGLVNLEINDLGDVLSLGGPISIGSAKESGENRAEISLKKAISNSYITGQDISGAKAVFLSIQAPRNIKMKEVNSVMSAIKSFLDEDAHILFSVTYDESLNDEIQTTILATGLGAPRRPSQRRHLDFESNANQLKEKVEEADRKIKILQDQLANATGIERRLLEDALEKERDLRELAEHNQTEAAKNLEAHKNEISRLKQDLEGRINKSIDAIKNSLVTTDGNIKSYTRWSLVFKISALLCFLVSTIPILWLSIIVLIPSHDYHSAIISTFKELSYLSLISTSLPVIVLLTIGTTLLRHDSKLISEIQCYTEQKHQIERLAGLLQSAQYAAHDLNKSKDYVEETFTKIRDRLIILTTDDSTKKSPGQTDKSESQSKSTTPELKAISDLLSLLKSKNPD